MHKVFVYGSLKRGFHNNSVLGKSSTFLGVKLTERRFTMYNGPGFPYVIPEGSTTIVGELYEVDDATLDRLDYLEGVNADYYKRIEIPVHTDSEKDIAWIYVATVATAIHVKSTFKPVDVSEKYGYQVQEWRN